MKSKKKYSKKGLKKVEFFVIEQNLRDGQAIDGTAMSVMECLEEKVSDELLELLKEMLLGFSEDMQLELADDLLDFACSQIVHTTGCITADAVLGSCYKWIAEEKGIEISYDKIIMN